MSEDNQDNSNNSFTIERKDKRVTADWDPTVPNRITVTETRNEVTVSKKEFEVVRGDDSPMKMASRNDTLGDYKSRVRFREINSATTDTTKQANNEGDTSDN